MLVNGFDVDVGKANIGRSLPISFNGLLRILSGETTLCCSSFELPEAFRGASLICLFLGRLSVGTFATKFETSSSSELSDSPLKKSLSVYDFWVLFRGDVRNLAVVFVVCVVLPDSLSEPLATGLALRSRAMIHVIYAK